MKFPSIRPSRAPLALLAALAALAPALPLVAQEPPKPTPSPEAKRQERAALDAAFKSLEDELKATLGDYSKAIQDAQKAGLPREQWPKTPANDFYPRFETLALQDQPDALRWCLGIMPSLELPIDARMSKKDALYKRYVATCLDTAFTKDIIAFLSQDAGPEGLGVDRVVGFLDQIGKGATSTEVRAQALLAKGQAHQRGKTPEHAELATATFEELVRVFPKSPEAATAKVTLFHLKNLQVGKTPPDVTTADVDGNAFKLSDSRGKVTLLVFFAFPNRATAALLPQLKDLAAGYKDKPFTVVGVALDEKKDEFKKAVADAGIDWKIAWQDGGKGAWVTEWGIRRLPTVYLLDDQGTVRLVNPDIPTTKSTAEKLFAEMAAKKQAGK